MLRVRKAVENLKYWVWLVRKDLNILVITSNGAITMLTKDLVSLLRLNRRRLNDNGILLSEAILFTL